MLQCTFELNNKPMSSFHVQALSVDAFSGLSPHINKKSAVCIADAGPIPTGTYYILDRESGGLFGQLRDRIKGKHDWFALYAVDNRIDDIAYCNEVQRGNFRLHPKGTWGISRGCIVVKKPTDFHRLRSILKNTSPSPIPGTALLAYGKVVVR